VRNRERRVAEAVTALLGRGEPDPAVLAQVVGEAAGATGCALVVDGRRYQWGDGDAWVEQDIRSGDTVVGILAVAPESVGPLSAAVLGAPVAALWLAAETDRLRRDGDVAARALVDDRWRAAAEMEQERRGLERDLHDGAQHNLVALRMALALAEHTGTGAERLLAQVEKAERVLVETAAGILPGALVAGGLAAALCIELARHDAVTLDSDNLRRHYPVPVEAAVYFVVLEAVNNARKHAAGAQVTVTVQDSYQGLEFSVIDNGPGFAMAAPNAGLPNLTARVAAVGGTVHVRSAPGTGTAVSGVVPL